MSDDLADRDGENLCPETSKDKPGRPGAQGEWDQDYEDQIKKLVNPGNPTPRGYGYVFFNPQTGGWVHVDDCQHETGARVEIKGDYDALLAYGWGREELTDDWLDQSKKYIEVSRGFPVYCVFSQQGSADFAQKLFQDSKDGRERIGIVVEPRQRPPI